MGGLDAISLELLSNVLAKLSDYLYCGNLTEGATDCSWPVSDVGRQMVGADPFQTVTIGCFESSW